MNLSCNAKLSLLVLLIVLPAASVFAVYGDIVFKVDDVEGREVAAAVFPHWIHRIRYKCYACHPAPFEMQAGANSMTMESMQAGEACGACHNGEVAWGIGFDTCNRCHLGE